MKPSNTNMRSCHPWKFSRHTDSVHITFPADEKTAEFIREMCSASGKTLAQVVDVSVRLIAVYRGRRSITHAERRFIDSVVNRTGKSPRTVLTMIWRKVIPAVLKAEKVG